MIVYVNEQSARASCADYIRRQLSTGKTLAKMLRGTHFEEGALISLSPAPLGPTELIQFEQGHSSSVQAESRLIKNGGVSYVSRPKAEASEELAGEVYDLLRISQGVCILENALAEADDGWLQGAKSRVFTYGNEVYHVLFHADREIRKIEDAIHDAQRSQVLIGSVGSFQRSDPVASSKSLTHEQLSAYAKTVHCVFVGAYDGEGYIVWRNPSSKSGTQVARPDNSHR